MATINVDETTKDDLKAYCKKQGITQGDFAKFALAYFRKSGINPSEPPESVKEELAKIEKRVSQLIAFQKTFEKENMIPLLQALTKTEGKVNIHLESVPKGIEFLKADHAIIKKSIADISDSLKSLTSTISTNTKSHDQVLKSIKEDIQSKQDHILTYLNAIMKYGTGLNTLNKTSIFELYKKDNPK